MVILHEKFTFYIFLFKQKCLNFETVRITYCLMGPHLLTWINFNPGMDKLSHVQ